ncbi:MAG: YicC family protein [Deltaproteobacteria bacterium]|nr:MAG: YicC family protein [Deltaproteobacteria bacterium]
MKSMTGFGQAQYSLGDNKFMVEVRSVNHRFCEVKIRVPQQYSLWENAITKMVKERFARGYFEATLRGGGLKERARELTLDFSLAEQYLSALRELKKKFHLPGPIDVRLVAGCRELFYFQESEEDQEGLWKKTKKAFAATIDQLEEMRIAEGKAIEKELRKRLKSVVSAIKKIEARAPMIIKNYKRKLRQKVAELTDSQKFNADRIEQEVVIYANRCDISEEVARLHSHHDRFHEFMKQEPCGRRLDFLLQEMNRELNTIGAKANDAEISERVVELKCELERMREQVQNLE